MLVSHFRLRALSLNRMAEDNCVKGKRALNSILASMCYFGNYRMLYFFKLFETKVLPILLYGAEQWGFQTRTGIERIQKYACKRYMCLNEKKPPDAVVLGDSGRFPLTTKSFIRCLKYWLKILKMPESRYVRKCYKYLLNTKTKLSVNWALVIKSILFENNCEYVWVAQKVENDNSFIRKFTEYIRRRHLETWHISLNSVSKLSLYRSIKTAYGHEHYLNILNVRKYRHAYAQLRSVFYELEIEKGRYNNTPIADRLCKICNLDQVENELHFILICPMFDDLRRRYIVIDSISTPTVDNFYVLMSNRNEQVVKHLASYKYNSLQRRREFLTLKHFTSVYYCM